MSQDGHLPSRYALYVGSSSRGASGSKSVALVRTGNEDEVPCTRKPIDMISVVSEFHALSKEDLSILIKDGRNGNIQWTKSDGTSFETNVEDMARKLSIHLVGYYIESKQDEQLYKYLLAGVRLLHTLCDLASRHGQLQKVLFDETESSGQKAHLVYFLICFLHNAGEEIDATSDTVHLHSALLASTLCLFKSIMLDRNDLAHWLDRLPEGEVITCLAFQAVGTVIKFLQAKLTRMQSSDDEVYHLFQFFEASLQFLYTLSQDEVFRRLAIQNKVLSVGDVVLKMVHDIMKLQSEDSYLTACLYRLKTKALYIMLYFCEPPNSSFLKLSSSMKRGMVLAKSTLSEALELIKKMLRGKSKDHPRGTLQLNAMRVAALFADDNNFKSFLVLNITESLTREFSKPCREFLRIWCSSERAPVEEDVTLEFDSVAASGEILSVIPRQDVSKSTYSTSRARQTPFAHQKSSFLVKIIARLTCSTPDMRPGEKGLLINKFLECLEMFLPNGAARTTCERAAAAMKNLCSLKAHAECLVPEYLRQEDVNTFSRFIEELEASLNLPKPRVRRLIPVGNDDNHSEGVVTKDHIENQSNGVTEPQQDVQEKKVTTTGQTSESKSVVYAKKTNNVINSEASITEIGNSFGGREIAEVDPQEETVRNTHNGEKQQKKRKWCLMNEMQEALIEKALQDEPDMRWNAKTLEFWAKKLSSLGDKIITAKQLSNWSCYRKKKLARAAAKAGDTASASHRK